MVTSCKIGRRKKSLVSENPFELFRSECKTVLADALAKALPEVTPI